MASRSSARPARSRCSRAASTHSRARSAWASSSSRPAHRLATPPRVREPRTSSIHGRSSAATRCRVPRIGHERTTSPESSAATTSARLRATVRSATEVSAPGRSWACTASSRRTASRGVDSRSPTSRWAASRSGPMSARVVTRSPWHAGTTVRHTAFVRAEDWDARYEERRQWSEGPNALVAELLGNLPPGTAVDLASGEGRHALWLASLGWDVTAVDFSAVGLDRGRSQPGADRVRWVDADVLQWAAPASSLNLVLIAYLHLAHDDLLGLLLRSVDWLRPGGRFLLL